MSTDLDPNGLPPNYNFQPDWEVTPREVKQLLDAHADFELIDCRLPRERDITKIEPSELIPVQELAAHFESKLDGKQDRKIIVYCRSGGRSMQFAQALRRNGFNDVKSMAGGILLWNKDINPGGPQY
ncbi:MAG TPA: rhodanese-like domain-containing protein [Tepidisphaeraceae bacterium]|nr:rhodanese-like domain-containing protein [Tepidisphaeraceae bacterium]